MKSRPRLIDVSLLAIRSRALVTGKVQVAGGCIYIFRIDADATRGAILGTELGPLNLLTPRKKDYIQCPSSRLSIASVLGSWTKYNPNGKGELNMGEDVIKGGEPPVKKKPKKKAAPKKAAKKKAAKKK